VRKNPAPAYNEIAMPTDPASPRFPLPESLTRFFRLDPRARVPLAQVAELLGTTPDHLGATLRDELPRSRTASIAWTEAAAYLFDAWSRADLLDALGPDSAGLIPAAFHLTRVPWSLPIFVVRAMEHQAARTWQDDPRLRRTLAPDHLHARRVDDYLADLLYAEIQPETLRAFRDDRAFLRAFYYPVGD
jgi:hypothetical protein